MRTEVLQIFNGAIVATGDSKANKIAIPYYKQGSFFIKCTAWNGTTLDVDLISYDPITDDWYVRTSFTQITGTGKERKDFVTLDSEIAAQWTFVGTSATFIIGSCLKDAY